MLICLYLNTNHRETMQTTVKQIEEKTKESARWYFSLQILQKFVFFGSGIVLARILSHEDFGLASISLTLDFLSWVIVSMGVNSAVIHFQNNVDKRLNAAFWMFILSSIIMTSCVLIFAPYIAKLYNTPLLIPILRVSAISMLIYSFGAVHKTILYKNLEFKKVSILEGSLNILKNLLFIGFALAGFKVWSFIYPKIIVSTINVICLWQISGWRPKFKFYFKYWIEMFKFGSNILFANILDFFLNHSSHIFIGSMVGPAVLGIYAFANDKSMMTVNNIAYPVTMIAFPAFSKLQEHQQELKDAFFKTVKMVSLITFPYTFGQILIGAEYITLIFGEKWEPSIIIFQTLLLFTMLKSVCYSGNSLLSSIGKPDIILKWNLCYTPFFFLALYLGIKSGGIYGVALAITIIGIIANLIYIVILSKALKTPVSVFFKALTPAFISSALMGTTLFFLKIALTASGMSSLSILLILIPCGMITYALFLKLLFEDTFNFILNNLIQFIGKKEIFKNVLSRKKEQKT